MSYHVKICGLSEETTLRAAIDAGANMIGFVHFSKSPRHVSLARAAELKKLLPENVASVVVLVDADDALIDDIVRIINPTYLQLHGSETPTRIAEIRAKYPAQKLIKALAVSTKEELSAAAQYELLVDAFLFDAKPPTTNHQPITALPGGNGVAFDWKILHGFNTTRPWLLSGGLTLENVQQAIRMSGAKMVDVSSGVESKASVKDAGKIKAFIEAVHA